MEKAEIFSFPTIPGFGGWRKMVKVVITLDFEVLGKMIASSKFCPMSESPMKRLR